MNHLFKCSLPLIWLTVFSAWSQEKGVMNDQMYPPAESARPFINYDGAGFIINGQRAFLTSGSVHYPRVPRELWYDRLLRLKQADFSTVQTYAFWNYNEPAENRFDFSGDKDLGHFLDTAQKLGLYATVRVGPYVCAEWDSGGYPLWLRFKPPFKVRENNPDWLKWNDHWYDKILPLVAKHQINHGGNVTMVQLENEHPLGWGVVTNNPYFVHLHDDAVRLGIQVPFFMSGQHHGGAPTPGNLDPATRSDPWITTEFWAGWYNGFGPMPDPRTHEIETAIWTIIAHGGGGYNFYMIHGGTDFDAWNNDEVAASYDFGAAIGQAGDLRPLYYQMKRANQLAQSFPDILANGGDARGRFRDFAAGPGLRILGARESRGDAGTLVFLQNRTTNGSVATFKSGDVLAVPANDVYPFPRNVRLTDSANVLDATLPMLALAHNGPAATLVLYGPPGATGHLTLAVSQDIAPGDFDSAADGSFSVTSNGGRRLDLTVNIPANGVKEFDLNQSGRDVRVLAMNEKLALYTWVLGGAGKQYVVVGPAFVQSLQEKHGSMSATVERPYGQPAPGQVAVFGGPGQSWHLGASADLSLDQQPAPALANWQMAPMHEASPAFDDSRWKHSDRPLQMGADGDISAFAWYRTSVNLASAGSGVLRLQGADDLEVFVNGRHVACEKGRAGADFVAGANFIAVFTSHHGRNKDYNYLGTLNNHDNKGLWGTASLEVNSNRQELTGWAMRGGVAADLARVRTWAAPADTAGVPAFYRATFVASPPAALGAHPILRVNYQGLSRGTFWINGHNLGRYPEKVKVDSLYVPECWLKAGQNTLTVFDETGASPANVSLVVETAASREVILASQEVSADTPITVPETADP